MNLDIRSGHSLYRDKNHRQLLLMLSQGVLSFDCSVRPAQSSRQWFDLLSYRDLASYICSKLMLASNGYSHGSLFNHWYVKDAHNSFGPFSLLQMLEFFCQKRIHLDSLVRHPSEQQWQLFCDSGPFEVKSLEKLLSCEEIQKVISRRRHPRVPYSNQALMSSRAELYRGMTCSLSTRGLGLITEQSSELFIGDRLNIIVNPNSDHEAIQVKGTVVQLSRESNYERLAVELDHEHGVLNHYIHQRVPQL